MTRWIWIALGLLGAVGTVSGMICARQSESNDNKRQRIEAQIGRSRAEAQVQRLEIQEEARTTAQVQKTKLEIRARKVPEVTHDRAADLAAVANALNTALGISE
jgi:uncharacterized membrane-anchored protein YhcB (DUF1043 family)